MLATSAMYDILDAFATPGRPTRERDRRARSAHDVEKLAPAISMPDGGWGYFRGMKTDPFVTMQVLAALAAQKEQGDRRSKNATAYVTQAARRRCSPSSSSG